MTTTSGSTFNVLLPNGAEHEMDLNALTEAIEQFARKSEDFWTDAVFINAAENQAWISLFRAPREQGCIVSCCGISDSLEFFAINGLGKSAEVIKIQKSGSIETYAAEYFVPLEIAIKSLLHFARTLERSSDLQWAPVGI